MTVDMNLAEDLFNSGNLAEAGSICMQALKDESTRLEALFMLGNIRYVEKEYAEAAEWFSKACGEAPGVPVILNNLGLALMDSGRLEEAEKAFLDAVDLDAGYATAYYNLARVLEEMERIDEALFYYKKAIDCRPDHSDAYMNIGAIHAKEGRHESAIAAFEKGMESASDKSGFLLNLGTLHAKILEYEKALYYFGKCLELDSGNPRIYSSIGNVLGYIGMPELCADYFRKSIELASSEREKMVQHSCMLFYLHYSGKISAREIAAEHFRWGALYEGRPAQSQAGPEKESSGTRPLRIGYVSPDFRIHAVVFFIQPVLASHDGNNFRVYCYSNVEKPDKITRQLREHPVIWRDIYGMEDEEALRLIREDGIDILVDLAGHSAHNRLTLFALKPSPIQVTWLGYPDTTGLRAMDYRITDAISDPSGLTEEFHTEELLRLPDSFLCYRPGGDFPEQGPSPCASNGYITFGAFNNFAKVTPEMMELWTRILRGVPTARLILKGGGMSQEGIRKRTKDFFVRAGIDPERIEVLGRAPSVVSHLEVYNRVDISLDTYPYNGTTTTFESLWLGVPVVSLAGMSHVSRVGASILTTAGLSDLVAYSDEEYVEKAVRLARDTRRVEELRSTMRDKISSSPLMDSERFTRNLEKAFKNIWDRYCRKAPLFGRKNNYGI